MAELRVASTSATERLAARIAEHNGLTPEEGRAEAGHALGFLSALLGLPAPETLLKTRDDHGTTPQGPQDERRAA